MGRVAYVMNFRSLRQVQWILLLLVLIKTEYSFAQTYTFVNNLPIPVSVENIYDSSIKLQIAPGRKIKKYEPGINYRDWSYTISGKRYDKQRVRFPYDLNDPSGVACLSIDGADVYALSKGRVCSDPIQDSASEFGSAAYRDNGYLKIVRLEFDKRDKNYISYDRRLSYNNKSGELSLDLSSIIGTNKSVSLVCPNTIAGKTVAGCKVKSHNINISDVSIIASEGIKIFQEDVPDCAHATSGVDPENEALFRGSYDEIPAYPDQRKPDSNELVSIHELDEFNPIDLGALEAGNAVSFDFLADDGPTIARVKVSVKMDGQEYFLTAPINIVNIQLKSLNNNLAHPITMKIRSVPSQLDSITPGQYVTKRSQRQGPMFSGHTNYLSLTENLQSDILYMNAKTQPLVNPQLNYIDPVFSTKVKFFFPKIRVGEEEVTIGTDKLAVYFQVYMKHWDKELLYEKIDKSSSYKLINQAIVGDIFHQVDPQSTAYSWQKHVLLMPYGLARSIMEGRVPQSTTCKEFLNNYFTGIGILVGSDENASYDCNIGDKAVTNYRRENFILSTKTNQPFYDQTYITKTPDSIGSAALIPYYQHLIYDVWGRRTKLNLPYGRFLLTSSNDNVFYQVFVVVKMIHQEPYQAGLGEADILAKQDLPYPLQIKNVNAFELTGRILSLSELLNVEKAKDLGEIAYGAWFLKSPYYTQDATVERILVDPSAQFSALGKLRRASVSN